MRTNRLLRAALALAGITGTQPLAFAADLPAGTIVTKAPAAALAYRWTGCYLGANVGGGVDHENFTNVNPNRLPNFDLGSQRAAGAIGGGQIGCDYQAGNWVFGGQVMAVAAGLHGSNHVVPNPGDPQFPNIFDLSSRISSLATATARLGYAIQPQTLLYARGGGAWMRSNLDYTITGMGMTFPFSAAQSRAGWTVGGGIEFLVAPNWSLFAEYNHMDFGTDTLNTQGLGVAAGSPPEPIRVSHRIDTATFGVNYRFGSP
jgi:outer membrane immunogenic protein